MKPIPKVVLHPETLKQLQKGHPWVIKDTFTQKFPKKDKYLIGTDKKGTQKVALIHDPAHPTVKARAWGFRPPLTSFREHFKGDLFERLEKSIFRRMNAAWFEERENCYLVFGEADLMPGFFLQKLGSTFVVQTYTEFWNLQQKNVEEHLKNLLKNFTSNPSVMWEKRNFDQKPERGQMFGHKKTELIVEEFGVKYNLEFTGNYDFGLYTDMSSIRSGCKDLFNKESKVLNLYSYTGAWSLFPLSLGAKEVTSVDLSSQYMQWLEENLVLNEFEGTHRSLVGSVNDSLSNLEGEEFDLIVCDPPSFSTDGKEKQNSLQEYKTLIPKLSGLLSDGGKMIIFLNTHKISRKKFNQDLEKILAAQPELKKLNDLKLGEDCPLKQGFPEGDYLKGMVIQKN